MLNKILIFAIVFVASFNFLPTIKVSENVEKSMVLSTFNDEKLDFKLPQICGYQQVNGWRNNRIFFK